MDIRMDYRGARRAEKLLTEREQHMRDLTPVMKVYASRLRSLIDDSFEHQRNPAGVAWPVLQESTIKDRQRRRGMGPVRILIDSSDLRTRWYTNARRASILIGNNLEYMPAQQFGTKHIPARAQAPVELRGGRVAWMNRGEGKRFKRDLNLAIRRYIQTGRVR